MSVASKLNLHLIEARIIGTMAIGYHRTKDLDIIKKVEEGGFTAGGGATYGKGIYLTYDIASQLEYHMAENYGPYIIKSKVSLQNFLIYEPDVAKLIYKNDWQLPKQFAKFGLVSLEPRNHETNLKDGTEFLEYFQKEDYYDDQWEATDYTSRAAGRTFAHLFHDNTDKIKRHGIRGIIFKGRTDGKVIVSYFPGDVLPYAYTGPYISKNENDIEWAPISPKGALTQRTKQPESLPSLDDTINNTMEAIRKLFNKNKIINLTFMSSMSNRFYIYRDNENSTYVILHMDIFDISRVTITAARYNSNKKMGEVIQEIKTSSSKYNQSKTWFYKFTHRYTGGFRSLNLIKSINPLVAYIEELKSITKNGILDLEAQLKIQEIIAVDFAESYILDNQKLIPQSNSIYKPASVDDDSKAYHTADNKVSLSIQTANLSSSKGSPPTLFCTAIIHLNKKQDAPPFISFEFRVPPGMSKYQIKPLFDESSYRETVYIFERMEEPLLKKVTIPDILQRDLKNMMIDELNRELKFRAKK